MLWSNANTEKLRGTHSITHMPTCHENETFFAILCLQWQFIFLLFYERKNRTHILHKKYLSSVSLSHSDEDAINEWKIFQFSLSPCTWQWPSWKCKKEPENRKRDLKSSFLLALKEFQKRIFAFFYFQKSSHLCNVKHFY